MEERKNRKLRELSQGRKRSYSNFKTKKNTLKYKTNTEKINKGSG